MTTIEEGALRFEFPDEWDASKFDAWSFYKGQFQQIGQGEVRCKKEGCEGILRCSHCNTSRSVGGRAIDILAVPPGKVCWCIEIKDYRKKLKRDYEFLADEVALKLRDTLACLVAVRLNTKDDTERERAKKALARPQIRVVLHLELRPRGSPLAPSPEKLRADVLQRLKERIKAIDHDPLVVAMGTNPNLGWTVSEVKHP